MLHWLMTMITRVNFLDARQRRNKKDPRNPNGFKQRGKIDKGNGKRNGKNLSGCFECGKPGHMARNCRYKKRNEKVQKDKPDDQTDAKVNMVIDGAEIARNNEEAVL